MITHLPGGMPVATFLRDYWQKKPLLIRQAYPDFQCPVDGGDLAGLACEAEVESRIVQEKKGNKPWQVASGPFDDSTFSKLPKKQWTLLVQGLDHWSPEVADLLDDFRFIPNWRVDDVMASYAVDGGSVGPHYDYYDVFLLQGAGRRHWQVGGLCDECSPRLDGTPLRILSEFTADEEWVLEPGDMLYLPPQFAHYGRAVGDDCITLSVGFRSPTHEQVISSFADFACRQMAREQHLDDPDLPAQENPGEIGADVLARVRDVLMQHLDQPESLARWFGEYSTEPKHEGIVNPPEKPWTWKRWQQQLQRSDEVTWNEGSRFAFIRQDAGLVLFADGVSHTLSGKAAEMAASICHGRHLATGHLAPFLDDSACQALLLKLTNTGSLIFP